MGADLFRRDSTALITEIRTYVGQTGTQATDGFLNFCIGQSYQLCYEQKEDFVIILLDHVPGKRQLVINKEQFETWFRKT